jgi:tRNA(Ile)-lysidine synthase
VNGKKKYSTKKRNGLVRASPAKLTAFARNLLQAWWTLALPTADASVIVAVSGGADSTALLLALDELIKTKRLSFQLIVAHLDHRLRKQSSDDARWVASLARELGYDRQLGRADVSKRAMKAGDNLEQAARRARYEFFAETAIHKRAEVVLTAHTMDDQAETVLLRLMRGSGADGLIGIETLRPFDSKSQLLLVRPLISWAKRSDTENYCRLRKIDFLADEMNQDERFARVRVRKRLLPLMQSFNPRIVEALTRTAELLRDDVAVLDRAADELLRAASDEMQKKRSETKSLSLNVNVLTAAPAAIRRRALRKWIAGGRGDLRRVEMAHLRGIEKLLEGGRGGRIAELPNGDLVMRRRGRLELRTRNG